MKELIEVLEARMQNFKAVPNKTEFQNGKTDELRFILELITNEKS